MSEFNCRVCGGPHFTGQCVSIDESRENQNEGREYVENGIAMKNFNLNSLVTGLGYPMSEPFKQLIVSTDDGEKFFLQEPEEVARGGSQKEGLTVVSAKLSEGKAGFATIHFDVNAVKDIIVSVGKDFPLAIPGRPGKVINIVARTHEHLRNISGDSRPWPSLRIEMKGKNKTSEIALHENEPEPTKKNVELPRSIVTANGSVYYYLPDGRTQRYKTATHELKKPCDMLVFIPSLERLKKWVHFDKLPKWITDCDTDIVDVTSMISAKLSMDGNKTVGIFNKNNNLISSNDEARNGGEIFLLFYGQDGKVDFYLPVYTTPQNGDAVFEMRFGKNKDGEVTASHHFGNKVVDIKY